MAIGLGSGRVKVLKAVLDHMKGVKYSSWEESYFTKL